MILPLPSRVIKSRRRTISLEFDSAGSLIIRAPRWASQRVLDQVVTEKMSWITKTQRELAARPPFRPPTYLAGERFPYLGQWYPLVLTKTTRPALTLAESFIMSEKYLGGGEAVFTHWYKAEAKYCLTQRVALYSAQCHKKFDTIRITSAQKQWGSCAPGGRLCFSWRLIMAPLPVIDYVVLHELAHMAHPNHSRDFWREVAHWDPEYRVKVAWLKKHGHRLRLS